MQYSDWKKELQQTEKDPRVLLGKVDLQHLAAQLADRSQQSFPMRAPRSFTARIKRADPDDVLLRQILPVSEEDTSTGGFETDPLSESEYQPVPGILHKYHGRALLVVTGACAIHCRYCFRRHFPYADANPSPNQWNSAVEYLNSREELREIILSGGDPLTLTNDRLGRLFRKLADIRHLQRLRIHSRIPVVLPDRIDTGFLEILHSTRFEPVLVVHANHAREIDTNAIHAINKIRQTGVTVFNQAVLLRGINDSIPALKDLSNTLFDAGIIPYYLHMLDPVQGAAHFEVE
ncbi:MAG TPA: EF-P beta-lysylation protein EpmB, partial [Gammaproteobacteria bacterium]|nr:EF-P beta-lysylation protein EpmB [Gammaproteobacteria bacterium]